MPSSHFYSEQQSGWAFIAERVEVGDAQLRYPRKCGRGRNSPGIWKLNPKPRMARFHMFKHNELLMIEGALAAILPVACGLLLLTWAL